MRLAGQAVNAYRLRFERDAEVVNESGDARVLDAGVGLELVCGDDGAGADVLYLSGDVELLALLRDALRNLQKLLVGLLAARRRGVEVFEGGELVVE